MPHPAWARPCQTDGDERAAIARSAERARTWRLAIGGFGLFWVCAALWLVGAFIP